jgi:signal transduction histidine kinase
MMHEQLIRSERLAAVGQVSRGIGHEFGNILLRVVGKTDLALMEKDIQKIHDHLKVVMTAAERASVIVRNLQSFSRDEPQKALNSLTKPIDEAVSLINHELVKNSVTLVKDYKPTPDALIDTGGIGQVVLNLLINAAHAMTKGGQITVRVEPCEGPEGKAGVAARVIDTGTGIPPEVLPRIFEFAFTTKGDRGGGLGLSVSKEIVEAHGGKILVKTEAGRGTEFTLWFPLPGGSK